MQKLQKSTYANMTHLNELSTLRLQDFVIVGTPLSVSHFRVGDYVDVQAKT